MKKKIKKERKPTRSFAEQLRDKFIESGIGKANFDRFNDASASWVEVQIGLINFTITFDDAGKNIKGIGMYKDQLGIVSTEQIFRADKEGTKEHDKLKIEFPDNEDSLDDPQYLC